MSFNVLYVEHDTEDVGRIERALDDYNREHPDREPLYLEPAWTPEEVQQKLSASSFDAVIADVVFETEHRLDDIIGSVRHWSDETGGRPLPIIAYTRWGKAALAYCLERSQHLYDIWDKSTASPAYVAWRLSKLAAEVSRIWPDKTLIRCIRDMTPGASWHDKVADMVRRYDRSYTDVEQIKEAGSSIADIGDILGVDQQCRRMWDAMTEWEPFGRVISPRGHARHAVNVFWLGYWLLHHAHLRDYFAGRWTALMGSKPYLEVCAGESPLEGLANAWFYTGLFHDIGVCLEKQSQVMQRLGKCLSLFQPFLSEHNLKPMSSLRTALGEWLRRIQEPGESPLWRALVNVGTETSDHGMAAALILQTLINKGKESGHANEAARAISLHGVLPSCGDKSTSLSVTWEREPLACLLMLCDQIQTWDREHEGWLSDEDVPQRAELSDLHVRAGDDRAVITMSVDYIATPMTARVPVLYRRVRDQLTETLREKPKQALNRISEPWPFGLEVDFFLSGDKLDTRIEKRVGAAGPES